MEGDTGESSRDGLRLAICWSPGLGLSSLDVTVLANRPEGLAGGAA